MTSDQPIRHHQSPPATHRPPGASGWGQQGVNRFSDDAFVNTNAKSSVEF